MLITATDIPWFPFEQKLYIISEVLKFFRSLLNFVYECRFTLTRFFQNRQRMAYTAMSLTQTYLRDHHQRFDNNVVHL